jgi:N6-adenosine-specific RNA methylase IME4
MAARPPDWPTGRYGCIVADPPWTFRVRSAAGEGRAPQAHYGCMDLAAIQALPVAEVAADDCWLWLWCTWPLIGEGLATLSAWGFDYSGLGLLWVKLRRGSDPRLFLAPADLHIGLGYTTRANSEPCLLGRRGRPARLDAGVPETLIAPVREHSRKPDEAAGRIERFCAGPRLELFARTTRPGWDVWGNQTDRFAPAGDHSADAGRRKAVGVGGP